MTGRAATERQPPPPVPLQELLVATGAEVRGTLPAGFEFRWIERNSREVAPGDLFIAVRGERFDGHDFVADAAARGASAALVRRSWADQQSSELPLLVVDDPVTALQQLAARRLVARALTVVGITGSLGKTSTKEVVAAVLGRRFRTYRSPGNMNSEIGLPLSLLEAPEGTEVAVLEMGGAYAPGELALLAKIARPRVGIVTNVHPIHLERMGTIEAIAATKAELAAAIPPDGVLILNGDDPRVTAMQHLTDARTLLIGRNAGNDLRATNIRLLGLDGVQFDLLHPGGVHEIAVPLLGDHAVELALTGIAAGLALGMKIEETVAGLRDPAMQIRLVLKEGPGGSQLIDDTYNAAAPSVLSALVLLGQIEAARRIAVLGDMRELGDVSDEQHRLVGQRVAAVADVLVTFGELARTIAEEATTMATIDGRSLAVTSFGLEQRAALVEYLLAELRAGDTVLLKGSRGLEMETIVEVLVRAADDSDRHT